MAAFTAFGPMWGIVSTATDSAAVRVVVFTDPVAETVPEPKRALKTSIHWERDASGKLVCQWCRAEADSSPPK